MVKSDGKMTRMEEAITFVKTWQSSDSVDEVAKKMGINKRAAHSRANHYRRNGVKLKNMPRNRGQKSFDWKRLAKIAEEERELENDR